MRHWHLFHTSALAWRLLPCWLRSSAACLLSLPVPALLRLVPFWAQCPHVLPSTRYFLPCEMFHACFYNSSTQSPDALFSIVSKPPTRFFIVADSVFFLSKFRDRGFKTTASGFSNHRPVVQHTDRGFPEHRPVFQSGFHYLCTTFRTIGRGFSRFFFLLPAAFCLRTPTEFFTRLLFLFFSPYRSWIVTVHFPVTYAFPSHGGIRL